MHRLQVVHEDVQIQLFFFSLEGIAFDWYRSLPIASISSLADFHAAFHVFCKGIFSNDFIFPECCHEFNLLNKNPNIQEDFVVEEDISNHDQEFSDPHFDNHDDSFYIVLNASIKDGCHQDQEILSDCNNIETYDIISDVSTALDIHENQHISFEGFEVKEQIYASAESNRLTHFRLVANTMSRPQLSDLQT